ncbi:PilN domain-containing protein [Bacillus sp. 1P10SD]|uniref:PilN domain-containing protein n=1 Tax=Bacillus sp. 1P10SD TaxID=3132265 RepID=UPI0039A52597
MLVDINLLPQNDPKKINIILISLGLLALFILISGYYFWQTQTIKDKITSLDKKITIIKDITDKEQQNSEIGSSANSVSLLKSAIAWASDYPLQTVPVMQHLTSLLPERGFILSFAYTEAGTVTLTVQFDSAREAAYFLDSLHESKWIEEASLNSLSTTQPETETNAAFNTAASNSQVTTSGTTTSANQTTTDPNTVDYQNNTTDSTTKTNQTNQSNTTTTANQSNVNTAPSSSTIKKSTNYLPRYTGQFEIKFNKEEIKKSTKKNKTHVDGVEGS